MLKKNCIALLVLLTLSIVGTALANEHEGAIVLNPGEGQPTGTCIGFGLITNHITAVVTPAGEHMLNCHFDHDVPLDNVFKDNGFTCFLNFGGSFLTTDSKFVATPGPPEGQGKATLTCKFSD